MWTPIHRATASLALALTTVLGSSAHAQATVVIAGGGISVPGPGVVLGQTFRAPLTGADRIDRLSFWVGGGSVVRGYLYAWDPVAERPVGPPLATSPDYVAPLGLFPFPRFELLTSGVAVTAGGMYAALVAPTATTGELLLEFAAVLGDPYPAGTAIGLAAAGQPARWGAERWSVDAVTDYRFEAAFSTTAAPEPATVALLAPALVAVGAAARRRGRGVTPRAPRAARSCAATAGSSTAAGAGRRAGARTP